MKPMQRIMSRALGYSRRVIADEISLSSRFYDGVMQWRPLPHDSGELRAGISAPKVELCADGKSRIPDGTVVLLNGNLNHCLDIQGLLSEVKGKLTRGSRVMVVAYNPYARLVFRFLTSLGIRAGEVPSTFITRTDLTNLARLSGFEVTRTEPVLFFPLRLLGLGSLINTIARTIPVVRWAGFAAIATLRPVVRETGRPSLTVVVPARNEKGNVGNIIEGLSSIDDIVTEAIFVEGHSNDGTWEEINRAISAYRGPIAMKAFQQTGKGKKDAVRLGFSKATADVLTILDADLTVPCEALRRFYAAYREGHGDFINGSRLVYPMEDDSMRFLNRLGNIFFAKALCFVLDTTIGDSLCGTKLMSRRHYESILRWCEDFGDFDPFGDFELLFPAASLGLGLIDVPVRYLARVYGTTNISRFRHGFQLLRMTLIGFFTIRMGRRYRTGHRPGQRDGQSRDTGLRRSA